MAVKTSMFGNVSTLTGTLKVPYAFFDRTSEPLLTTNESISRDWPHVLFMFVISWVKVVKDHTDHVDHWDLILLSIALNPNPRIIERN